MKKGNRKILLGLLGVFLLLVGLYVYHMNTLREGVLGVNLSNPFKWTKSGSSGAGKDWTVGAEAELSQRKATITKLNNSLIADAPGLTKIDLQLAIADLRDFMAPEQGRPAPGGQADNAKLVEIVEQFDTILGTGEQWTGRPTTDEVADSLAILKQDGQTINDAARKIRRAVADDPNLDAEFVADVSPLLDSARTLGEQLVKIGSYDPTQLGDAIAVSKGNVKGIGEDAFNLAVKNATQEGGMIDGLNKCLDIVNAEPGIKFIDSEGVGSEYRTEVKNTDLATVIKDTNAGFKMGTFETGGGVVGGPGDTVSEPGDTVSEPGDTVSEPWGEKAGWHGNDIYIDF